MTRSVYLETQEILFYNKKLTTMKLIKKLRVAAVMAGAILALYSFTEKGMEHASVLQNSDWVAPKSADNLKNPFKGDETALKKGKITYQNMCAICHGDKGKGDGMAGMSLKPRPANFTSEKVQSQSDGALFWKLTTGRAPMAAYKDIISEEQRWQLVNYIRTFKKQ
tara:strand:- start:584 stop:1081 length:498 start_codon:yes stop_codon:yes gene_type:complete